LQKYELSEDINMKKLVLVALMLTVLTGWSLDETLQEIGEGVRTGVGNAEEGAKEAPGAISEAGNEVEADAKKKDTEDKDDNKED
jgi:ribosomal protein L12E/L44/L45/RPP1/RPP2